MNKTEKRTMSKKDALLPGLRVTEETARRLRLAMEKLGVDLPNFRRQLIMDIINISEQGDQIDLPPRVMRIKKNNHQ